jgi:hypothetical protein
MSNPLNGWMFARFSRMCYYFNGNYALSPDKFLPFDSMSEILSFDTHLAFESCCIGISKFYYTKQRLRNHGFH